jgi:hypothetical protein
MRGGLLANTYRRQFDSNGNVGVTRVNFVRDAVSTTTPHRGRGVDSDGALLARFRGEVALLKTGWRPKFVAARK